MPKIKISRATVEKIPNPENGQIIFWDSALMGFGIRVTKGSKTFIVQKRIEGKPVRVKIGNFPQVKAEAARKEAHNELARMSRGVNPNDEKMRNRAQNVTLLEAIEEFFNSRKLKPRTVYNYRNLISVCFRDWMVKSLASISKDMVERRHKKIGIKHGEAYANFSMRVLRSILNFAAARYEDSKGQFLIIENPVRRLSQVRAWYKVKRRDDCIRPNDLPVFFEALDKLESEIMRDFFLVLLFTGLRREEAASLKWSQVDFKNKTLTILDTKNDEKLELPLSYYLEDLLKRRYELFNVNGFVFPGGGKTGYIREPKRAIDKIRKELGAYITVHGLRRTFIMIAESLDISHYALKRLINHKMSGDVTAQHYLVHNVERLREPMRQITDFILQKAGRKGDTKVLEFREKKVNFEGATL